MNEKTEKLIDKKGIRGDGRGGPNGESTGQGDPHEPPPRADVSDALGSSDAGFAASARVQRRSVISCVEPHECS